MVNPIQVSKVSIKLLKQPAPTQYRMRAGEFRVFYDVEGEIVWIIQVLSKQDAIGYLAQEP
jgi:mRNA-degrading endonuclease RelE of RelBE toxin-antitoxin system